MILIFRFAVLLLSAVLGGCAATDGFGDSVRHMVGAQIHNPAAAENPPVQPPQGLTGDKAAQAMKAYRSDTPGGKPDRAAPVAPVPAP